MAKILPPDYKQQGYVVDGSLSSFTGNIKGQAKQDILNATLFAQLTSNEKHNRQSETADWYKSFLDVLEKIGFIVQAFSLQKYHPVGSSFSMEEVVQHYLKGVETEEQLAIRKETIKGLSDKQVSFSKSSSTDESSGDFQIFSCDQKPNGEVVLVLGCFYFRNLKQLQSGSGNSFSDHFSFGSSDVELYGGVTSMLYREQNYSPMRASVSDQLGERAARQLAEISI